MGGVAGHEVLVVSLGGGKASRGLHRGDDRLREDPGTVQLGDVARSHPPLLGVGGEDRRAVLAAHVGPLAIQLRGVVGHREEHLQQLAVAHPGGVVGDADAFGVAGSA